MSVFIYKSFCLNFAWYFAWYFACVLLQLLLKQIPKQKLSKAKFIHSSSVNSSGKVTVR